MNIHFLKSFLVVVGLLLVLPSLAMARDQIRIVGSSTVYPFSTVVAERHGQKSNFKTPVIEATGTGGGMKLFCGGIGEKFPDIVNASREMKASEWELCRANGVDEIVELPIGNDGIAFANSVNAKRFNFTLAQLWQALAEKGPKPSLWSEVDPSLPSMKIEVLMPPPTSGTRDTWNSQVLSEGCPDQMKASAPEQCELLREDGAVIEAGENDTLIVQKLNANPSAFGIFGFSYLQSNLDKIQASTINGISPTLEKIQSLEYPIARPLYVYVKKAHVGVIPGIREYLKEYTSKAAMGPYGYLADVGLIPLTDRAQSSVKQLALELTPMKALS